MKAKITFITALVLMALSVGCRSQSITNEKQYGLVTSNNLQKILLNLYGAVDDSGRFPKSLKEFVAYDVRIQGEARLEPDYFVCPGTGSIPASMNEINSWTDYIFIGNVADYMAAVPFIVSPPENHHGKYGYVATALYGVIRLPPSEVRALIKSPWLISTNETQEHIENIKREIIINVPPRLRTYYPE